MACAAARLAINRAQIPFCAEWRVASLPCGSCELLWVESCPKEKPASERIHLQNLAELWTCSARDKHYKEWRRCRAEFEPRYIDAGGRVVAWRMCSYWGVSVHLEMEQHDVYPKMRPAAAQAKTGLCVQAVMTLQGTGERQLGHTASVWFCHKIICNAISRVLVRRRRIQHHRCPSGLLDRERKY